MSKTIPIQDLEKAIKDAVADHKIGHGPIVIGFVPPQKIEAHDAQLLAEKVSKNLGFTADAAKLALRPGHILQGGHIIIGLIAPEALD